MNTCQNCSRELPPSGRFCPACGTPHPGGESAAADRTLPVPPEPGLDADAATIAAQPSAHLAATGPGSVPGDGSRFVPGTMLADRYRIVGLLGRGGMGEVYRADDLKLGQPVALKFLPEGLENSPDRLQRFLAEVRTARQVTHPNVCRVYDIDEIDGQHFLSMEYVDGEDLSSLLTRIGRLPQERAVEVSRQICAGLGAAHDQGILHRDLKPANVMIDGRGRVRLTDFGLAGLAGQIAANEVGAGTPAYMAPEQIAGREVTTRSDIYALGLVLYEIFTGKRTFEASTVADMQHMHTSAMPSNLTRHVTDLDPAVESAVLRCLEKEPADRPVSALAVAAALPGGDPLAAALAAGETPSPELVAEAGEREGVSPRRALLMALLGLVLVIGGTHWAGQMTITNFLPLQRKPAVLEDRARSIIAELGYDEEVYADPVDQAWGLITWNSVVNEVAALDSTSSNPWQGLRDRPDAYSFWYRQSPRILLPDPFNMPVFMRGPVTMTNPSPRTPGEISVLLDGEGHLRRLEVMPKRYSLADTITEPDWQVLFRLAGLDPTRFSEDRARYQRFLTPDRRRAWVGTHADRPEVEMRIDAGSYEGRPVLFNLASSASLLALGDDPQRQQPTAAWYLSSVLQPLLILMVVVFSIYSTKRNLNQGRADRRGAVRFGTMAFALFLAANALESHSLFTRLWADEIWPLLVGATFIGMASWSMYSAAEPLGRRVWPTMFVSSNRLLSRPRIQWRDPLLGYSLLIGLLGGGLDFLIQGPVHRVLAPFWTGEPSTPLYINLSLLQSPRLALAYVLDQALLLVFMFVFVVALIVIRKAISRLPLALAVTLVVWTLLNGAGTVEGLVFNLFSSILMMVLLLRWGVVAMVASRIVMVLAWQARAADWGAWHAQPALLILTAIIALAVFGVWAAVGSGRTRA